MKISLRSSTYSIKAFLKTNFPEQVLRSKKIVTACLVLAVAFFSCDSVLLTDTSLLPAGDSFQVSGTDTVTIITSTQGQDSLITSNTLVATFGQVSDQPHFGQMRSSIYMQFRLPTNNVDLGDSIVFDSCVLALRYNGDYGDLAIPMQIELLELTEQLDVSLPYYNFSTFSTFTNNLAQTPTQILNTIDSVYPVDGPKFAQLRIRIDDAWGENLMNQSGGSNFQDNASFRNFFPGFYLTSTHTNGDGFAYLNLVNVDSRLTLYYHTPTVDSLFFNFPIGDESAYITHSEPDYTGTTAEQLVNNPTQGGDSIFMAQSLCGLRGKVEFPYLQSLQDVAINKAELIVTLDDSDTTFPYPNSMLAVSVDAWDDPSLDVKTDIYEAFFGFLGSQYFSAGPENVTINGISKIRYVFNISAYVQNVVNGSGDNKGLYLFPFLDNFRAGRATFYGGNHSQFPVTLNLTYTKIE
jgi:hypothetical protein